MKGSNVCVLLHLATTFTHIFALERPNIVFLLEDDQDLMLGGASDGPLPRGSKLMANNGATLANWFAHTPVCCPSRAQILTGKMFHNLNMKPINRWDLQPNGMAVQCMHINESRLSPGPTFAKHLASVGYSVGFFGKYLNISPRQAPTGSHTYFVNPGPSSKSVKDPSGEYYPEFYYYQTPTFNGTWNNTDMLYETSMLGNFSTKWIREVVENNTGPFFAYIAPHAPHGAAIPAPWYQSKFNNETFPITPSFNYSGKDHHWLVRQQPPVTQKEVAQANNAYGRRWACLLSVDDLIIALHKTISDLGIGNNTYLFQTSDHGFHFHELRLGVGKWNVYDTDIRVPMHISMHISGPGIKQGVNLTVVGSHVDLAPTWLALAGVHGDEMDGRSIVGEIIDVRAKHLPASVRLHLETLNAHTATSVNSATTVRPPNSAYIEYHGLGPVGAPHRWLDSANNTYRALRIISDTVTSGLRLSDDGQTVEGNLLYAEFGGDFLFKTIVFHEVYDLAADPWQLTNIYNTTDNNILTLLRNITAKLWQCEGGGCA